MLPLSCPEAIKETAPASWVTGESSMTKTTPEGAIWGSSHENRITGTPLLLSRNSHPAPATTTQESSVFSGKLEKDVKKRGWVLQPSSSSPRRNAFLASDPYCKYCPDSIKTAISPLSFLIPCNVPPERAAAAYPALKKSDYMSVK